MQLECIACTQCIDACNGVMERLGRPRELIGYRSLVSLEGEREAQVLRPRVLVYGALLAVTALTFTVMLARRLPMDLHVAHNRSALASPVADGRIGNAFTLHIQNRDRADHAFHIRLEGGEELELVAGVNPVPVSATSAVETRVFVVGEDGQRGLRPREFRFVLERVDDTSQAVARSARFVPLGVGGGR